MVEKCLECKYFKKKGSFTGECELHLKKMAFPDSTCDDFTCAVEIKQSPDLDVRIRELEDRISQLERIVLRLI